jgi:hypothetical protein
MIPDCHDLVPPREQAQHLAAFNQWIFDAGLKTQNYAKVFDRVVRQFDQEAEVQATMAVVKGSRISRLLDIRKAALPPFGDNVRLIRR